MAQAGRPSLAETYRHGAPGLARQVGGGYLLAAGRRGPAQNFERELGGRAHLVLFQSPAQRRAAADQGSHALAAPVVCLCAAAPGVQGDPARPAGVLAETAAAPQASSTGRGIGAGPADQTGRQRGRAGRGQMPVRRQRVHNLRPQARPGYPPARRRLLVRPPGRLRLRLSSRTAVRQCAAQRREDHRPLRRQPRRDTQGAAIPRGAERRRL